MLRPDRLRHVARRRTEWLTAAFVLAVLGAGPALAQTVITNVRIADGSGSPLVRGSVRIEDDRIVAQ